MLNKAIDWILDTPQRTRRAVRRFMFRRLFPNYVVPMQSCCAGSRRPVDQQVVFILDADHRIPVWIAEYDAVNNSYQANGGWFEAHEIDYWAAVEPLMFNRLTKD